MRVIWFSIKFVFRLNDESRGDVQPRQATFKLLDINLLPYLSHKFFLLVSVLTGLR